MKSVRETLEGTEGVVKCEIDFDTKVATCEIDEAKFDKEAALAKLDEAGFPSTVKQ